MNEDQQQPSGQPQPTAFQQWERLPEEEKEAVSSATEQTEVEKAEAEPKAASSPESDPDDQDQEPVEEKEEKLPKGLKKRFRELTSEIKDLKARLNPPAPGEVTKPEPVKTEPAKAEPGKPLAKDFETYEAFIEAVTDWKYEQREAARAQAAADREAQAETEKRRATWIERTEAAKERYEDYEDAVSAAAKTPISQAMHDTIVQSDSGPDLIYYFAHNPEDAARIAKLSPFLAAKEIGRIEAKLDTAEPETPKKPAAVSRAPKPPKAVNGSAESALGKEPDPKDFVKWNRWKDRQEQLENAA